MRRDLVAIAIVIATGGWVCDSSDSCAPGELACSSDVADDICCPQGLPYNCNGHCSATPQCSDYLVCKYPDDPGSGLCTAGAYVASIGGITCIPPTSMQGSYRASVSGTLIGCGSVAVMIQRRSSGLFFGTADCGTWNSIGAVNDGSQITCVPQGPVPDGTEWHLAGDLDPTQLPHQVTVEIILQVTAQPVLASATLDCPP
jgi:hypothetical protein